MHEKPEPSEERKERPGGRKPYRSPKLKNLGSIAKLTRGATGNSVDFRGNRFKRL